MTTTKSFSSVEQKFDESDMLAETTDIRFTHDEVFGRVSRRITVTKGILA